MVGHCTHCSTIENNNFMNMLHELEVGARIRVSEKELATVKYIGEITDHQGKWIGVEWDDPERGKHNGCVDGVQYFQTSFPMSGSMIRTNKISEFETVRDAIECRYLFASMLDQQLFKDTQRQLKASLFEFVADNKTQDKDTQSKGLTTVSLPSSNINRAGDLSPFGNLLELDLMGSLLSSWYDVASIVRQLPKLEYLDLTRNRLELPLDEDIADIEPYFRHVKSINLRRCNLRQWANVLQIARLWPNIESLALADNSIASLTVPDTTVVFKNLRFLDLKGNPLNSFNEILKLGHIDTLETLFCISNHIEKIVLPDCAANERLDIFKNLKELNIQENHIDDQVSTFNELDKLASLVNLVITVSPKVGFEETFTNAIGYISQLTVLNKKAIVATERRGAEYDIWKRHSADWVKTNDNAEERGKFLQNYRGYATIVGKYGSPDHLVSNTPKTSKFVMLKLVNANTKQATIKRIPRSITVSTLQSLITKVLHSNAANKEPQLKYIDNENNLEVIMDNTNKTLDYYSIQDGNSVIAEWK